MSELNNQIRSLQEVHGTEKLLAAGNRNFREESADRLCTCIRSA